MSQPKQDSPLEIFPPVTGNIVLLSTRGHHPNSKDIYVLDAQGRRCAAGVNARYWTVGIDAGRCPTWECLVHAPFAAQVIKAENDVPDRIRLHGFKDRLAQRFRRPGDGDSVDEMSALIGNHLILQSDNGLTALLCHLRQGSLLTLPGKTVEAGEPIARIGNSGQSLTPHLHFHLTHEHGKDPAIPLPFRLREVRGRRSDAQ